MAAQDLQAIGIEKLNWNACENVGAMETILIFSVAELSQIFSSVLI
jgi:hypothetical protein